MPFLDNHCRLTEGLMLKLILMMKLILKLKLMLKLSTITD